MTEEEKIALLQRIIEELIPFNQLLNIKFVSADPLTITIDNREELVGNPFRRMLHGGVISTMMDVVGGIGLLNNFIDTNDVSGPEEVAQRMSRVATIDLRVDYLRPGIGERFTATAEIIRPGKRVTVTRMELRNEQDVLIAVGTGTYAV